jgi:hypothetical protein
MKAKSMGFKGGFARQAGFTLFDAFKARIVVVRQECTSLMPKDEDAFVVNMGG